MGYWSAAILLKLVPQDGAIVRTQLGPLWIVGRRDGWNCSALVYQVGLIEGLAADQAAEVLNLIGAFAPREEDQIRDSSTQEANGD